jgi:hypothetical protein
MTSTIYLYEDNAGGLHARKDDGPVWDFGTCGAITGPEPRMFLPDALAWLKGDWEPGENDGQHTCGDTEPAEGNKLIATCDDERVTVIREHGEPVAGGSGRAYLGPELLALPPEQAPKRQCYWVPEEQFDDEGWIPSLVTEGEPGHDPFTGKGPCASPWHWGRTLDEARATAARMNEQDFHLSEQDVLEIRLSSIAAHLAAGGERRYS